MQRQVTGDLRGQRIDGVMADTTRDIAVIGLACRFPGAPDPPAFQRMLAGGVNAVRIVPPSRWDAERYYDPQPGKPGKSCSRWGAFLDDVAGFDAGFFRISPREAKSLDPQQRLLLETACEALESAGQPIDRLEGSRTGVFVGICGSEYAALSGGAEDFALVDKYYGTGTALSVAAGRIAYALNFNGPTLSVETACSSSLVALHLAVNSLRLGEADMCLAGGVNVALSPSVGVYFSQLGAVSPSPACRPFDAEADGYVRGEGCGLVLLKRLADALRDGDHICAVIKGSAVNQDGRSAGLTAPNGAAQEALIRAALADGGIDAAEVDYVETHGTGTRLGDPIEANALGRVYGKAEGRARSLLLGAVKANIGHLEAAAGIAGFIKAVLSLQRGRIPPQINLRERNPLIAWDDLRLAIATQETAWPESSDRPRHAAVSSFGFSGTNAHLILAEPPAQDECKPPYGAAETLILPLSARSPAALQALGATLAERLAKLDRGDRAEATAICRGMALRRAHHPLRLCAVGETPRALADDLLAQLAAPPPDPTRDRERTGLALVFSGQGSHWAGMGEAISAFPVAEACIAEIDALVFAEAGWSVREAMDRSTELGEAEIDIAQVCIFAAQMALFRLWTSLGLGPAAVVGHSMGEIAAACAAGILSLQEAVRLCVRRSQLLKRVAGQGLMAMIELGQDAVADAIAQSGLPLWIAGANSPASTVVSGAIDSVRSFVALLEADRVFCRVLRTGGVAGHSPLVAPLCPDLVAAIGDIVPRDGSIAFVSTVDAERKAGRELDAHYWERNLSEPVRFSDAIGELMRMGCRDFVEISPKPILAPSIRQRLRIARNGGLAIGVLHPDQKLTDCVGRVWGALYSEGYALDWQAIYPGRATWTAPPAYPWMRERHWITDLRIEPDPPSPAPGRAQDDQAANERVLETLLQAWDNDGLHSVNMRRLAPLVLLTPDRGAAFYLARAGGICLAWAYLGPPERFQGDVAWLQDACATRGLALCLLADRASADAVARIARGGYEVCFAGANHRIEPLDRFDPGSTGRRRLRGQLRRYTAEGGGVTAEYAPGRDPRDDAAAIALIDGWIALKDRRVPAAEDIKREIRSGKMATHRRIFAARRGARLHALFVLTRFATGSGHLLDLEFYDQHTPQGCTESAIVDIVARLAGEGARVLSLGGSYCAALSATADDNPEGSFARQARYKRKFGAVETPLALLHPAAMTPEQLDDLIGLISGAARDQQMPRIADAADVLAAATENEPPAMASEDSRTHPLLGRRLSLAGETIVHETRIAASHSLVRQHVVNGRPVLPGAAYVEMALAAAWPFRGDRDVVLREVVFERPLLPASGSGTRVQLALAMEGRQPVRFTVHAADETRPERWLRLAAGSIAFESRATAAAGSRIATSGGRTVSPASLYAAFAESGVEYGPLFRCIRELACDGESVVAQLALDDPARADDGNGWLVHPALLDAAMQSLAAGDVAGGQTLMIQSAAEIRIHAALSPSGEFSVIARGQQVADDGTASGELEIRVAGGELLLQARGLLARPSPTTVRARPASAPANAIECGTIQFVATPVPAAGWQDGTCIVAGGEALADALMRQLGARGISTRRVAGGGEAMLTGLAALQPSDWVAATRLVLVPERDDGLASPGIGPRLHAMPDLVRLLAERAAPKLRVWLVTHNATGPRPSSHAVGEAALWSLAAVLRAEHPEWWGGVCDVRTGCPVAAAAPSLAAIVTNAGTEDSWVLDHDGAHVPRLAAQPATRDKPLKIAGDGVYVVTGWSGGIGRRLVSWLLQRGAGRLALLARRPPEPALAAALAAEAQRANASLVLHVGDAAEPEVIEALLGNAVAGGHILRGIFHAAGALGDGLLINQQRAGLDKAFAGKVMGAWNLHVQTKTLDLDAFVLFSSSATLFGPPAQGPHAAACGALDRIAELRHAAGHKALSVGWGPWRQIGKAAERGLDARLARDGILSIGADGALETMADLVGGGFAHAYVSPVDWPRWRAASPWLASRALFADVAPQEPTSFAVTPWAGLDDLDGICGQLCASVARTLLCNPAAVDRTRSLEKNGLDSIMIVELRERLGRELGRSPPLLDLFRAPSIEDLAAGWLIKATEDAGGRRA
jgi:acyl transferase domain-containing protein